MNDRDHLLVKTIRQLSFDCAVVCKNVLFYHIQMVMLITSNGEFFDENEQPQFADMGVKENRIINSGKAEGSNCFQS
jgi:hypothetical protein